MPSMTPLVSAMHHELVVMSSNVRLSQASKGRPGMAIARGRIAMEVPAVNELLFSNLGRCLKVLIVDDNRDAADTLGMLVQLMSCRSRTTAPPPLSVRSASALPHRPRH
jgi:hypothetical protein